MAHCRVTLINFHMHSCSPNFIQIKYPQEAFCTRMAHQYIRKAQVRSQPKPKPDEEYDI